MERDVHWPGMYGMCWKAVSLADDDTFCDDCFSCKALFHKWKMLHDYEKKIRNNLASRCWWCSFEFLQLRCWFHYRPWTVSSIESERKWKVKSISLCTASALFLTSQQSSFLRTSFLWREKHRLFLRVSSSTLLICCCSFHHCLESCSGHRREEDFRSVERREVIRPVSEKLFCISLLS